jgi:hypothetical protein
MPRVRQRTDVASRGAYRRPMLHDFLTSHHQELIRRCRQKATTRFKTAEIPAAVDYGVPLFLQQVADTLRLEQTVPSRPIFEPEPTPAPTEVGRAAALHGAKLLRLGYTIDQVVHEYGDVCQSVTDLAVELKADISSDEFRTLNRCLDNAIADAVTSYGDLRQTSHDAEVQGLRGRSTAFSTEYRRLVDVASHAYSAIRTGHVGVTGATSTLLVHALDELRSLAEPSAEDDAATS